LASLQLHVVQCIDQRNKFSFGDFMRLRALTTAISFAIVTAAAIALPIHRTESRVIVAAALAKSFESLSDLCNGRLQKHERFAAAARSLMLRGVLAVVALAVVFSASQNLPLAVLAMAGVWAAALARDAWLIRILARNDGAAAAGSKQARLLCLAALSTPLGLTAGVAALEASLPRLVVQYGVGSYELGIFGVISYLTIAGNMCIAAATQVAMPRIAALHDAARMDEVRRLVKSLVFAAAGAGLATVVLAIVVGAQVLRWGFGPEYAQWHGLLILTAVAAPFQFVSATFSAALRSLGRLRVALAAHVATLAVTLPCCIAGATIGGVWGVGVSLIVAGAVATVVFALFIRRALAGECEGANVDYASAEAA
jgi:O-antigen/teichoic acid export membrane protein